MTQINIPSFINQNDLIDDKRVQYYIDKEIKSQPYLKHAILNQKKLLQFLTISGALISLGMANENIGTSEKLTFVSLLGMAAIAPLRAKRQTLEKKIDLFSTASEKFAAREIINSEPKTLAFVSGQKYIYRFKSIQDHNKTVHKIQLATSIVTTGLLGAFLYDKIDTGTTLMSSATLFTASNVAQLINANKTLQKVRGTFSKSSLPTFLKKTRTKE